MPGCLARPGFEVAHRHAAAQIEPAFIHDREDFLEWRIDKHTDGLYRGTAPSDGAYQRARGMMGRYSAAIG